MLAANGKRLARRATGNQVNTPTPCLKILVVNIALNERPVPNKFIPASLVCADGFASIMVVFENRVVLKARI